MSGKLDVTARTPKSACWNCQAEHDACSGDAQPGEGDFTLCIKCGCLSVFQADLSLRPPTDDELALSTTLPDVVAFRKAILQIAKSESEP